MSPIRHRSDPRRSVLATLCVRWTCVLWTCVLWTGVLLLGAAPALAEPLFDEVGADQGFDFVHWNAMAGELHFVEMMGPGAALADFDGDGDLDVYIVQGAQLGEAEPIAPVPGGGPARDRLFRNDLDPSGKLRFTDVTAASGLMATGYGQGAATGDVDNDGDLDLYLANYGGNQLWLNQGVTDGVPQFADVTATAGVDDERWSVGASFFDYDRDGWLDLFVVDYVEFNLDNNVVCYAETSRRDYCGPDAFPPVADRLYRNLGLDDSGQVRFEEVSVAVGLARTAGPGLGVVAFDVDGDRWLDVFVANDGRPNFLWLNRQNGTFVDDALLLGVAVNRLGRPEASMGVAVGDFDSDGDEDLFMTHLLAESNTLYVNQGGFLDDRTREANLEAASLPFTAFGTGWLDVDHDGWLDLVVVNGAVRVIEEQAAAGDSLPLAQRNQLFRSGPGAGPVGRRFEDWTERAGASFGTAEVSRGASFGDLDNDGDVDVLVLNNNGPARMLLNQGADADADADAGGSWLGLRLVSGDPGRDALGSRVAIERRDAPTLWRRVATDGSFSSASDPRVTAALGGAEATVVRVDWADGASETFAVPEPGRYTTLVQGQGRAPGAETSTEDGGEPAASENPTQEEPTVGSETPR